MKNPINNNIPMRGTIFSKEAAIIAKAEMQWNAQQWKLLRTKHNCPIPFPINATYPIIYPGVLPQPNNNEEGKKVGN